MPAMRAVTTKRVRLIMEIAHSVLVIKQSLEMAFVMKSAILKGVGSMEEIAKSVIQIVSSR
jgi:lipoate synthase